MARPRSMRVRDSGPPYSSESSTASSSKCDSTKSASRSRMRCRSTGVEWDYGPSNALRAAATAWSTSGAAAAGTSASGSPSDGLIVWIVSPDAASVHWPPVSMRCCRVLRTDTAPESADRSSRLATWRLPLRVDHSGPGRPTEGNRGRPGLVSAGLVALARPPGVEAIRAFGTAQSRRWLIPCLPALLGVGTHLDEWRPRLVNCSNGYILPR